MRLRLKLCLFVAAAGSALPGHADDCKRSAAPARYALSSVSPLLGADPEAAVFTVLRADGCVTQVVPAHHRDAGTYRLRLTPQARDAWLDRLDATGVRRLDPTALRRRHEAAVAKAAQNEDAAVFESYDENLIAIEFIDAGGASRRVYWSTLARDRANHPHDAELRALGESVDLLRALGHEVQSHAR